MIKIAIVGGSRTDALAPYDDPEWRVWVHGNQFDRHVNRDVDMIFEIHEDLSEHPPIYPKYLADQGIHMIVSEKFPIQGEHIKVFPFDDARALMGGDFLTSTPAYMMAYAILLGVDEISIFGVDMAVADQEYFYEQPVMQRWIGFAQAKGIKVNILPDCPLGEPKYIEGKTGNKPNLAHAPFTEEEFKAVAKLHADQAAELEAQITAIQGKIYGHLGCKQTYDRLAQIARAVNGGQKFESLSKTVRLK